MWCHSIAWPAASQQGRGTLGRLTNDPALHNQLSAAVTDLNAITTSIRNGEGSLENSLNDPAMATSLTTTTQNLETLTGRLNRGEGTAGKLITDTALYERFASVAQRLDTLTTNLNSGEARGLLLRDKQLYENMNKTVGELGSLIAEIKKDPKKYLNVKVSISKEGGDDPPIAHGTRQQRWNRHAGLPRRSADDRQRRFCSPRQRVRKRESIWDRRREGRARAQDAVQHGREIYQSQREQLTGAIERGREAFQQARERGEQQA